MGDATGQPHPHLTLQPAGSLCLECKYEDQYCELCKKAHCVCRGFDEKNHPTEEHKVKGAVNGFILRKSDKKLKKDDLIQITLIMKNDGKLNHALGRSIYRPGIEGKLWTKNTYPVTKDSVRWKEMQKSKADSKVEKKL